MKTIRGIGNGAVLQRDENDFCDVTLCCDFDGAPSVSRGTLCAQGNGVWRLTGIPVGGPYQLTFTDCSGEAVYSDLYVGDVWLLAGQSNMEGAGVMTDEDDRDAAHPSPLLRAFYMDDRWDVAKPVMRMLHRSVDAVHRKTWEDYIESLRARNLTVLDLPPNPVRRGVGPGLYFAREMYRLTGVPQGLIMTAVGGAPIGRWLPTDGDTENYYTAACRRLTETGSHIRGVFWSQGEGNPDADIYPAQIAVIRKDLCRRLGVANLPFVQMQSFKCTVQTDPQTRQIWSRFREMQRQMPASAELLSTVATNDLELDDCIHLSSDSQKIAGLRAAGAMYHLLTGEGTEQPYLRSVTVTKNAFVPEAFSDIHVRYDGVVGRLRACGVPFGFALGKKGEDVPPSEQRIQRIVPAGDEIVIRVEISEREIADYELWYGFGNSFYCNITDEENRAIPAMGPIPIKTDGP